MLNKLIEKYSKVMARENNFTNDEQEQIQFIMKTFICEVIKTILIISLFSALGYFKQIVIILIVMLVTKPFIGGYHEDNQMKCFVSTIFIISGILFISLNSKLTLASIFILNLVCVICVWFRAPVLNPRMPITRERLIRKNKIIGTVTTIFCAITSIILFKYSDLAQCIVWTINFQTLLMFNKLK